MIKDDIKICPQAVFLQISTGKQLVDLWKAKTQEGGGKVSQEAMVASFLEELRRLPGTENVIKQIKSECMPAMQERLTKRLAKEIIESGMQGRGRFNLIFYVLCHGC